jgi:hypothetical protein
MTRYASALIEDLRVQFLTQHPACLNIRGCSVRPAFRQIARAARAERHRCLFNSSPARFERQHLSSAICLSCNVAQIPGWGARCVSGEAPALAYKL